MVSCEFRPAALACALLLAALAASGCANPCSIGRSWIDSAMTERMGHSLGPELPPCETAWPTADLENGLTEEDAASLALWNHPGYQELLADLKIARADVIQAGQLTNPQLSTLFPLGPKAWEFWIITPIDVIALRPHRVEVAEFEAQRVAERLVQDGLNVVRDARTAYIDLQLTDTLATLARENDERIAELTRIGEARLKAGAISELDLAPLRVERRTAKDRLDRAAIDRELARQRLAFLIGLSQSETELKLAPASDPSVIKAEPPTPEVKALVAEAVATRPDIRAVDMAVEAACERNRLSYYDYFDFNIIFPDLNVSRDNQDFGPGLRTLIPLFHQNQGLKARTAADVERLVRQRTRLRDTAALEVRQAATRLEQARQSHAVWRDEVLPPARDAADAVGKALAEDGISLLVVLETTRQWINARQRGAETAAEIARARIELERSVGRRLSPPPGEEVLPPLTPKPEELP